MPAPSAPAGSRPDPRTPDIPTTGTASGAEPDPDAREQRLGLSAAQVAGSALAAVSAAVAASWLGVAGTVIGAALGSVFGTVGSAVYAHSLRQGSTAVRRSVRLTRTGYQEVETVRRPRLREVLPALPWRRLAVAALVALVVGLAALTALEGLTGRSVSGGGSDGRTTVGRLVDSGSEASDGGTRDTGSADNPAREVLQTPATTTGQDANADADPTPATEEDTRPSDGSSEQPVDEPADQPVTTPTDPAEPTDPVDPSPSDPATPEDGATTGGVTP